MATHGADDAVTVAVLDYEEATLHALHVLKGPDLSEMRDALEDFLCALLTVRSLSLTEREIALAVIIRRGRVPEHAWDVIGAALKFFRMSDCLDERPTIH
jgi:hypothetical protein